MLHLGSIPVISDIFKVTIKVVQVLAKGLGQGAALSSMAHLILMSVAALVLFGERMGPLHVAGLVNALATIWLFALASQSS